MVPATWLYHVKFMVKDGTIVFPQFVTGWKNVSIAGGLLALILLDASRPAWLFPAFEGVCATDGFRVGFFLARARVGFPARAVHDFRPNGHRRRPRSSVSAIHFRTSPLRLRRAQCAAGRRAARARRARGRVLRDSPTMP